MTDDRILRENVNCYACGYDLKGLAEGARCPECGLYVRFTLEQRYTQDYFARDDEAQNRWDAQSDRAEAQMDRTDAQADRYDQILDRWDEVLHRIIRFLDRLDKQ